MDKYQITVVNPKLERRRVKVTLVLVFKLSSFEDYLKGRRDVDRINSTIYLLKLPKRLSFGRINTSHVVNQSPKKLSGCFWLPILVSHSRPRLLQSERVQGTKSLFQIVISADENPRAGKETWYQEKN